MLLCSDIYYVVVVDDDREDVTWLNLNKFDVVFPSLIDVMPQVFISPLQSKARLTFKGIVHQFFFRCSNLIFWIVMGCGIADFVRRGL